MEHFASTTLWIVSLALPYLVFAVANAFRRPLVTVARGLIAVAVGWAFMIAYAVAAGSLTLAAAASEQARLAIYDEDGSKIAFAVALGWVLPVLIVAGSWLLHRYVFRRYAAGQG